MVILATDETQMKHRFLEGRSSGMSRIKSFIGPEAGIPIQGFLSVRRLARSRALRRESIAESPLAGLSDAGLEIVAAGEAVTAGFVFIATGADVGRDGLRMSHGKIGFLTTAGCEASDSLSAFCVTAALRWNNRESQPGRRSRTSSRKRITAMTSSHGASST